MLLGVITNGINGQLQFNFGEVSPSSCRDNSENVVEIAIFLAFFLYLKDTSALTRVKINRF
jgi:hypothetical protein